MSTIIPAHINMDGSMMISIAHGLKQTWDVQQVTLTQFLKQQKQNWGLRNYNVFETLSHGMKLAPYLDYDMQFDKQPDIQSHRTKCMQAIHEIFGADPDFCADQQVKVGYRHGWLPTGKYKVSFRFWVRGYSILMEHMPALIRQCSAPSDDTWDLSVYSCKRKMGVPGACKSPEDPRALELEDRDHPELCIIQYLDGTERELKGFDQTQTLQLSHQTPPEWDAVATLLHDRGFGNPVYKGCRDSSLTFDCDCKGCACVCCGLQHDSNNWWISDSRDGTFVVKNYSSRCKAMVIGMALIEDITPINFDTPVQQVLTIGLNNMGFPNMTSILPGECFTLQQHLQNCPTCRLSHAMGSNYLVEALVSECYTVRNEEKHCKSRIISVQDMVERHEGLSRISDHPHIDGPLADLYVKERGGNLTALDNQVFRFQNGRWTTFEMPDLENDVREFLDVVLRGLVGLLHHEEAMVQFNKDKVTHLRKLKDKFTTAVGVGESNSKRKQIVNTIRTQLHNSKLRGKWDSRSDLLGLDNGVIMLDTCTFRPADKDDYITMSTGYDWLETIDPEVEGQVENFFRQVYPNDEERALFQQWVGYGLTGDHKEKYLMLLTRQTLGVQCKVHSTFAGGCNDGWLCHQGWCELVLCQR